MLAFKGQGRPGLHSEQVLHRFHSEILFLKIDEQLDVHVETVGWSVQGALGSGSRLLQVKTAGVQGEGKRSWGERQRDTLMGAWKRERPSEEIRRGMYVNKTASGLQEAKPRISPLISLISSLMISLNFDSILEADNISPSKK